MSSRGSERRVGRILQRQGKRVEVGLFSSNQEIVFAIARHWTSYQNATYALPVPHVAFSAARTYKGEDRRFDIASLTYNFARFCLSSVCISIQQRLP